MSPFVEDLFAGRTAFFTGGTSGIGFAIAERFAQLGAQVFLNGRNAEKLNAALEAIRSAGGTADGQAADVRDDAAIAGALERCANVFGPIDFLFCAAAGNFPAPVLGMSANGFKAVVDIDLNGTFHTCRAAHAHLRRPGASIVAISANHATQPYALQAHVCAAKAGVDLLIKTLAVEWGPEGIRANCITPGPIDETEGMRRLAPTEDLRRRVINSVPLRRMGTASDIAGLAVFLCSPAAAYINGAVLVCDGGQSLTGPRDFSEAFEHWRMETRKPE